MMYSSNNVLKKIEILKCYNLPQIEFKENRSENIPKAPRENVRIIRDAAEELVDKARAEANLILAEAKSKGEEICVKAQKESEEKSLEKYSAAFEKGYKDGLAKANEKAQENLKSIIEELHQLSNSLSQEKQKIAEESKNLILTLAAEIAQKVAGESFVKQESVFLSMFRRAVKDMHRAQRLTVTVADKDYKIMTYDPQKLLAQAEEFKNIEIRADKNEQEGTLKLETAIMLLDASVNSQIGLLKKEIAKSF